MCCGCYRVFDSFTWALFTGSGTTAAVSHHGEVLNPLFLQQRLWGSSILLPTHNADPYMAGEILNRLENPSLIPEELFPRRPEGYCPLSVSSENVWGDEVETMVRSWILSHNSRKQFLWAEMCLLKIAAIRKESETTKPLFLFNKVSMQEHCDGNNK